MMEHTHQHTGYSGLKNLCFSHQSYQADSTAAGWYASKSLCVRSTDKTRHHISGCMANKRPSGMGIEVAPGMWVLVHECPVQGVLLCQVHCTWGGTTTSAITYYSTVPHHHTFKLALRGLVDKGHLFLDFLGLLLFLLLFVLLQRCISDCHQKCLHSPHPYMKMVDVALGTHTQ